MSIRSLIATYWRRALAVAVLLVVLGLVRGVALEQLRWSTYTSPTAPVFSIRYPKDAAVLEGYTDPLAPPGYDIKGVRFDLSQSFGANSTVRSAYVTVEYMQTDACDPLVFLSGATSTKMLKEEGVTYNTAYFFHGDRTHYVTDRVYVIEGSKPCTAFRTSMELNTRLTTNPNGPPAEQKPGGSLNSSQKGTVAITFDTMRHSLRLK